MKVKNVCGMFYDLFLSLLINLFWCKVIAKIRSELLIQIDGSVAENFSNIFRSLFSNSFGCFKVFNGSESRASLIVFNASTC